MNFFAVTINVVQTHTHIYIYARTQNLCLFSATICPSDRKTCITF